jgi:hypothetical protein
VQACYIDDAGLIQRHDYTPDVFGPTERPSASRRPR